MDEQHEVEHTGRVSSFKNVAKDDQELRSKRREGTVSLRKAKREEAVRSEAMMY